jgi:hypothetical protein
VGTPRRGRTQICSAIQPIRMRRGPSQPSMRVSRR